jgi:hypothetical protein
MLFSKGGQMLCRPDASRLGDPDAITRIQYVGNAPAAALERLKRVRWNRDAVGDKISWSAGGRSGAGSKTAAALSHRTTPREVNRTATKIHELEIRQNRVL